MKEHYFAVIITLYLSISSFSSKAQDRQYYIDFGTQFFMDESIEWRSLNITKRVNFNSTFGDYISINKSSKFGYGLGMGATRLIESPLDPLDPKYDYEQRVRLSLNFLVHINYKYAILKKHQNATYFNTEVFLCLDSFQQLNLNPGFNLGFSFEGIATDKFHYELTAYIGYTHSQGEVSTLGGRMFGVKLGLTRRVGR